MGGDDGVACNEDLLEVLLGDLMSGEIVSLGVRRGKPVGGMGCPEAVLQTTRCDHSVSEFFVSLLWK